MGAAMTAFTVGSTQAANKMCGWTWMPVCGMWQKHKHTYSNMCWAMKDGAKHIKPGACKW
jgi:hypothetical protein